MIYKKIGSTDVEISIFAMGGHEYLPDGLSRGFNEDFMDLARSKEKKSYHWHLSMASTSLM
jgi:hypothetical protein